MAKLTEAQRLLLEDRRGNPDWAQHRVAKALAEVIGTWVDPCCVNMYPARGYWAHTHQDCQRWTGDVEVEGTVYTLRRRRNQAGNRWGSERRRSRRTTEHRWRPVMKTIATTAVVTSLLLAAYALGLHSTNTAMSKPPVAVKHGVAFRMHQRAHP